MIMMARLASATATVLASTVPYSTVHLHKRDQQQQRSHFPTSCRRIAQGVLKHQHPQSFETGASHNKLTIGGHDCNDHERRHAVCCADEGQLDWLKLRPLVSGLLRCCTMLGCRLSARNRPEER